MTAKDYRILADVLRGRKHLIPKGQEAGWQVAVEAVVSACRLENSRFDEDTFLEACGCNSWDDRDQALDFIKRAYANLMPSAPQNLNFDVKIADDGAYYVEYGLNFTVSGDGVAEWVKS